MKREALSYAGQGWPIFPCRADKTPLTPSGVLDATTDTEQIEEWWSKWPRANIGFHPAAVDMVVIDLDPGADIEGMEDALGPLPDEGLISRTPRGGEHVFLSIPHGEIIPNSVSKIAKHIDVRSFHGYVLLPPSRTCDGDYKWLERREPLPCSRHYLDACKAAGGREAHKDRDNWEIEPDLEENIEACTKWLQDEAQVAIEGDGGDARTYATAAMCKSFGISPELAFDLLWDHWNDRCDPPWNADELENKITNAYSYNTSPPGNLTTAYRHRRLLKARREEKAKSGREVHAGIFRVIDREAMEEIRPPSWVIRNTLPRNSSGLIVGATGSFKTFVALDMALSVASGSDYEDWAGMWPDIDAAGPVLFAAGEGRGSLRSRVHAWEDRHRDSERTQDFFLVDPVPSPGNIDAFLDASLKMTKGGYALVFLDTVARSMAGLNENAAQDVSLFLEMIDAIQRELGATVIGLHHTGHNQQHRGRGSSAFTAAVDTEIHVERFSNNVRLSNTKQKDAEPWEHPKVGSLHKCNGSLVVTTATGNITPRTLSIELFRDLALEEISFYPGKAFTARKFADLLAATETIPLTPETIRKNYLPGALVDKGHPLFACYDRTRSQWRYTPRK